MNSKMKMRVAGTMLAMGVATIAVAGPASADQLDLCQSQEVCLYEDAGFVDGVARYKYNDSNYTNNYYNNTPQVKSLNDSISSIYNHGASCNTNHYRNTGYSWYRFTTVRNYTYSSLSFNDDLSSHKWVC